MNGSKPASVLIDDAIAAQQAGNLARARANLESALSIEPENPDALHLLGIIEASTGNNKKAAELVERALLLAPDESLFRWNLATIYEGAGENERAAEQLRSVTRLAPNEADAWMALGNLEFKLKHFSAAMNAFECAIDLSPGEAVAAKRLAEAALAAGDAAKAANAAARLCALAPGSLDGFRLASAAALQQRRWRNLAQLGAEWVKRWPADATGWSILSNAEFQSGNFHGAEQAYSHILKLEPEFAQHHLAYGKLCLAAQDFLTARVHLERSRELDAFSPETRVAIGRLHVLTGESEEAERCFMEAIKIAPDHALAYVELASLKPAAIDDAMLERMESLVASTALPEEGRAGLFLAIGAAYDSRSRFDEAFNCYSRGKQINLAIAGKEGVRYERTAQTQATNELIRLSPGGMRTTSSKPAPFTPVFVVGMPRSGTTLIESILAAHPDSIAAGEPLILPSIQQEASKWVRDNSVEAFAQAPEHVTDAWRNRYFSELPDASGRRVVIDKQPANFVSAGLIRVLFPEARIIHVRRDPVETCFSMYRLDFAKTWLCANHLEDLGHYYGEYGRLIRHWEAMLGDEFLTVQYEELLGDFEAFARKIVAFSGLDWRDECLDFHLSKRPVYTFSATQIRERVYPAPRKKSAPYRKHLGPLIDALKSAKVDLETGARVAD